MKKTIQTKEEATVEASLQEAFEATVQELNAEYKRVQQGIENLKHTQRESEAYDGAWADLYVSLNVLETKAHTLQEILDEMHEMQASNE